MRPSAVLSPRSKWIGAAILAVAVLALASPAFASDAILDNITEQYKTASSQWSSSLFGMAKSLFLKLSMIELIWFGIWWIVERDDPRQFFASFLRKIMGLTFFWSILLNFDSWIPAVINGFVKAGETAASTGALTPSTVMDRGLEAATALLQVANEIGLLDGVSGLGKYLLAGLCALGIVLSFAVIAGQMLVTLIESYIVVNGGVLFLGFAGSRWTTTFAEKFLSYAMGVGVKLFVTYLVVGVGQTVSQGWADRFTSTMEVSDYLEVLGGAVTYMFIAWQVPALASSMMSGSVSMTLGSAMATTGTMGAGVLGAAGLGAAAATGGVASVAGAMKAGSAAVNQARATGADSLPTLAAGTVSALASGMGSATADGIRGLGEGTAGASLAQRIDGKTAEMMEASAAGSAGMGSPATAGGAEAMSTRETPAAPTASPTAASSSPEASQASAAASAGTSAAGQGVQGSGASGPASAPGQAEAASSLTPAPQATPTQESPAEPTRPTPPAPDAPAAGSASGDKPGVFERLASGAEAISNVPNDGAAGTSVQINLKHD